MNNPFNKSYGWSLTTFDNLQEKLINKHLRLKKSDRILEVGCNRGMLMKKIQDKGYKFEGIDYSKEAVDNAVTTNVKQMDATKLEYPDNYFDKIYSVHTIEHVHNLKGMLKEIERVLKPKGKALFIYPSEPIRGTFVLFRAIFYHGNPLIARKIHVNKLYPKKLNKMTQLEHIKSIFGTYFLPQYLSVYEK